MTFYQAIELWSYPRANQYPSLRTGMLARAIGIGVVLLTPPALVSCSLLNRPIDSSNPGSRATASDQNKNAKYFTKKPSVKTKRPDVQRDHLKSSQAVQPSETKIEPTANASGSDADPRPFSKQWEERVLASIQFRRRYP